MSTCMAHSGSSKHDLAGITITGVIRWISIKFLNLNITIHKYKNTDI